MDAHAVGCREAGVGQCARPAKADRAEVCALAADRVGRLREQVGRGRLAVGARDAGDVELGRRLAEEAVGDRADARARPGIACTTTLAGSCGASRPGAGSQSTATAPFSTAAAACCTPCDVRPWQAMNALPGAACRLSWVRSDTSTSRNGRSASPSSAASEVRYEGAPRRPDAALTAVDGTRLTMGPAPARGSWPARAAGRPAVSRAGATRPTSPRRTPGPRLRRRSTHHRSARR